MKSCPFKKKEKKPTCSAVIVAAGSSLRMGSDKIMMKLGAMPVLARTVLAFENNEYIDEIIIVTKTEKLEEIADLCFKNGLHKVKHVVSGGATRMESALAGVSAARHGAELIAIHDGARPFVTKEIVEETIRTAKARSAAAPAIPVKDTIKRAEDGVVTETLDRSRLFAIQTPQMFAAPLIRVGLQKALEEKLSLTDDCAAVERLGMHVKLVEGDVRNRKITLPADLALAEVVYKEMHPGG